MAHVARPGGIIRGPGLPCSRFLRMVMVNLIRTSEVGREAEKSEKKTIEPVNKINFPV